MRDNLKRQKGKVMQTNRAIEILEGVSDIIISLDRDWRIIYVNGRIESYLGLKPEDLIEQNFWEKFPKLIGTKHEIYLRKAMQEGKPQEYEIKGVFTDRWFNVRVYTSNDRIIIYVLDITERKKMQEVSRENESLFQVFSDSPGLLCGIVDLVDDNTLRYIVVNKATARSRGLTPEAMQNKTSLELGEPKKITRMWITRYKNSQRTGKPVNFDYNRRLKGRKIWQSAKVAYLGTPLGRQPRFAYMVINITKRKQVEEALRESEERFRIIAETSPVGITAATDNGEFIFTNHVYERILGCASDELIGKDALDIFQDVADIEHIDNSLKNNGGFTDYESKMTKKDGSTMMGLVSGRSTTFNGKPAFLGTAVDITERKRAENALKQSEQKLRAMFDSAAESIVVADMAGNILEANTAAISHSGRSKEELVGQNMFVISSDPVKSIVDFDDILKEGRFVNREYSFLRADGTKSFCEVNGSLITNAIGKPIGLIFITRDVTQRKLMGEALRESEERFRIIAETSPVGIAAANSKGDFIFANHAYARMLGYPPDDLFGKKATDVYQDVAEIERILNGLKIKGGFTDYEVKMTKKDGMTMMGLASGRPTTFNGKPAFLGTAIDITDRKKAEEALRESEERFRKYFELGLVGMAIESPTGDWIEVNDRLCEIYGYPRDELMKKNWKDLTYPEDLEKDLKYFQQLQQGAIDNYSLTKRYIRKDGKIINCEVSVGCSRLPNNKKDVIYVLVMDITTQKKYEEAIVKAKDELEKRVLERTAEITTMTERLRTLSHRLIEIQEEERRNIARELHDQIGQSLNIVKILLDRASMRDGEDCHNLLGQARPQLAELIDRVSSLSLDLRPKMLDDLGLVQALEWYFGQFTEQTNIRVRFKSSGIDKHLSNKIVTSVYRIVQETLTNVARHALATIVTVELKAHHGVINLRIADNGIGFDPDTINVSLSGGITGMRERVILLGGTLQIHSKPGGGTRVIAEIPCHTDGEEIKA